jgi:peptidoglycan/LPS O-acetylase OafA/YrhL
VKITDRLVGLDVLRAFCIFGVLGRHFPVESVVSQPGVHFLVDLWRRAGWAGVDLFFVLSGFLVSGLLFTPSGEIALGRFWMRRAFKIYPSFYVLMALTILIPALRIHGTLLLKPLLSEALFVQNYFPQFWGHTWSLAVEEHFYLLLPLLLLFLRVPGPDPFPALPKVVLAMAMGVLLLRTGMLFIHPFWVKTHLFPTHLRFDSLMFGVLVSYFVHYRGTQFREKVIAYRGAFLAVAILGIAPVFFFEIDTNRWLYTVGLTALYVGFGCLVALVITFPIPLNFFTRILARVGRSSYSIYLWHFTVLMDLVPLFEKKTGYHPGVGVFLVLHCGGSLSVGMIMARAVEWPILQFRDRFFPSDSREAREPVPQVA